MNRDGKLRTWGDAEFARKLVEFAEIEVDARARRPRRRSSPSSSELFGPAPYELLGRGATEDYSPDVTGKITEKLVRAEAQVEEAVLHLVGAGRARTARTSRRP